MARVFPERLEMLDPTDVQGSIAQMAEYIDYMTERIDFAINNLEKMVANQEGDGEHGEV